MFSSCIRLVIGHLRIGFLVAKKYEFVIVVCTVVLIAAIVSHSITSWFNIETAPGGYWTVGPPEGNASVFMAGSSLARDGLSWPVIANRVNRKIEGWGLAGSSPAEWEGFQDRETHAKLTILVVSVYDLNEFFLSDYRAHIVPFIQTAKDLSRADMDWAFRKRVLSMYPLTYLRTMFPTAGRSDGVIRGLREKALRNVRSFGPTDATGAAIINDFDQEKITDWSPSMMLRRIVSMRVACQGRHAFNGPKKLAFLRMLHRAQEQGSAIVVILPVSAAYRNELLSPDAQRNFEELVVEMQNAAKNVHWVRLDRLDRLDLNEYFQDLVHMNSSGRKIATEAFLSTFREFTALP
jgi:hypothetical protein